MNFPLIIKLDKPLKHGDEDITEVKILREPVAGDLRDMNLSRVTFGDVMQVLSRISDCPLPILNKLTMKDLSKFVPQMTDFLDVGL